MWIGWLEFDLLLGDVHSLKQKRSTVRPVIAELQRKLSVSAAETGAQQLHRPQASAWPWCRVTARTSSTCSTRQSASSPPGRRWNCCQRGAGYAAATTTRPVG